MKILINCPGCGLVHEVEIPDAMIRPKERRTISEETRKARAERMRQLRAQGIGGRPKGAKDARPRGTFDATEGPEDGRQG